MMKKCGRRIPDAAAVVFSLRVSIKVQRPCKVSLTEKRGLRPNRTTAVDANAEAATLMLPTKSSPNQA